MSNDSPFGPPDEPQPGSLSPKEPTTPFESSPFEKGANVQEAAQGASFSLLHVFFWTFGIGLAMSVDTAAFMPQNQMNDDAMVAMRTYMGVARVVTGLGMGPLIGMLPFWYIYRRKGVSFPYHPGHWLILYYGFSFLVNVVVNWIQRATGTMPNFNPQTMDDPFVAMGPMYIGAAASLAIGGYIATLAYLDLKRDRPIWRLSFGVLAMQSIVGAIGSATTAVGIYSAEAVMWVGMVTTSVVTGCVGWVHIIMVIVAVVMDLTEKNRRDWLHWLPFILLLFTIVVSMVGAIVAAIVMM